MPWWLPLIHHLVVSLVIWTNLRGKDFRSKRSQKSHIFWCEKKRRHAAFFETPLMRSIGCWDFCQANWALPKTFVEDPAGNIARRLMSDIRYLFFSSEVDFSLNNTEYNRRIFTTTVLEQSFKKSHFLTRIDDPASAQGWKKKNAYLDILHDHCNLV